MRVAIVAESFLPEVNGVTNSVLRVVEHLGRRHHEAIVIAPAPGLDRLGPTLVERVPAVSLGRYGSVSVGLPTRRVGRLLQAYRPDVVHLAAPAVLGAAGAVAARQQGLPAVAVYQTDLAAYAASYGAQPAGRPIWTWLRWVHRRADLTLAPSTTALRRLRRHGIDRLARWGRGVDTDLFRPGRRDPALVADLSDHGRRLVVGYVGRLAPEKSVDLLAHLAGRDDVSLVVVGDGPLRADLERQLPGAWFAGMRSGPDLARIFASLDVFAHTGRHETFCQSVQEALASGVAVVAPAVGGPLDLVRHGHNGLLWSPWRPTELVAAVERLRDPDLRHRLAVNAQASVAGRTWEVVGDELLAHYRTVIEARGRAAA